jgi:tetratricopeptide (TPR) repeat protein
MSENQMTIFESEFLELNKQAQPIEWSSVRGHLANKLMFLSSAQIDQKIVEQLKVSFDDSSQEESPQEWAKNCNDYANALHACSQQEDAPAVKLLNVSLEVYKKLLMVWTRQDASSEWASTFNHLGMIFLALGERTYGKRSLEKSVAAFNNALTIQTVDDAPQEWAVCQNNMGVSLRILAELSQNIKMLNDSIECYEKALQVLTQEGSPLGWVMVTANLGDARIMLANQLDKNEIAHEAVADFTSIAKYFQHIGLIKHFELAKDHQTKAQSIEQKIGN